MIIPRFACPYQTSILQLKWLFLLKNSVRKETQKNHSFISRYLINRKFVNFLKQRILPQTVASVLIVQALINFWDLESAYNIDNKKAIRLFKDKVIV